MPQMKEEEISAAIAKGTIQGIAVDTAVFDKYGCNLEFKVVATLAQFKDRPVRLLLSEIVRDEIKAHIARDATDTQRKLKEALNQHRKRWKLAEDFADPAKLAVNIDPVESAAKQLRSFLDTSGATVVAAADDVQIAKEVLRRYFGTEAPFETTEAKKNEFPDAFALLSLEADARARKSVTLCVSPDKGWHAFCAQSEHLVCVADLNVALGYFNTSGRQTADSVMALWREGKAAAVGEAVERAFEYALDGLDFYPDADMATSFEVDQTSAAMQTLSPATATNPIIISADDESVTFSTRIEALVGFEAEFHTYVHDSIDGDDVPLGSVTEYTEETHTFELIVSVSRDLDPEPQPLSVDVAPPKLSVHFGYVDPFKNEDPTHEKY